MTASESRPVPVVVAGCGAITKFFYTSALAYLESKGAVKVVALCDPNEANRAAVHASFPQAQVLGRLEDAPMLAEGTIVVVASPPKLHAVQSIFALERGCAVLSEKPMAATIADAEAMTAAAARTKRPLAIGLYRRFFRGAQAIKDLITNQTLGPVLSFEVEEGGPFRWEAASDSFFRREITPGGVLYDTGVHTLDLLLWWFNEPSSLDYQDDSAGGVEANCQLRLHYEAGFKGEVRLSRDWITRNLFRVNFLKGSVAWQVGQAGQITLKLDGLGNVLAGDLLPDRDNSLILHTPGEAEGSPQAFIRQLLDVVAAVRTGSPVRINGPEGLRSLRLIEDCYRQRKRLPQPWLSPEETAGLARLETKGENVA
ncbi:MAG TPA: Gfo/Idh/MocA family oxidoreductase [Opitutaceae bacterium]|nr:Gfo/Idh/MocA family oxidoreductase [Opitutaceae bacterium]